MATSKTLRARAPRLTQNYVASIRRLFGDPETIPDTRFLSGKYITTGTDLGTPASNEGAFSIIEPIGFDIEINGKTYKEFSVAMAGWVFLRDPAGGSTNPVNFWTDILNAFTNIYDNQSISATFSYDHIFLPVWFDRNHSVASSVAALQATDYSSIITANVASNIASGINTSNWPYDKIDYGLRYVNVNDGKRGKCLLVRWTASQRYYGNRLKFELALYENGTIEYRYWPIKTFQASNTSPADNSSATVGVFWSQTGKSYLWRDFSPLLDYKKNIRNLSPLGGAIYDSGFTDSSAVYADNINANFWPKNGAIITFSPPAKPLKILPKKLISDIASTREIIRYPGSFDDRKTIPFTTNGSIHMPSMLPGRLLGDTGDINVSLRQALFVSGSSSGSFIIEGASTNKSAIDSQLAQLDAIEKLNKSIDLSFNESQKNYKTTSSTNSFYATGSSIQDFGIGFSSPLKSKTQFYLSLPVTKQTTMLATTSSMYYYNTTKSQWEMVNSSDLTSPLLAVSEPEDSLSAYEFQLVANPVYRVVETAKGFDAVGRRVVSGSNTTSAATFGNTTMQSDNAIGAVLNTENMADASAGTIFYYTFKEEVSDAASSEYEKSISDSSDYIPTREQKFNLSINEPFLLEKLTINLPLYVSGSWFNDVTTCTRAFTDSNDYWDGQGRFRGAVDFGGPGITVALFCHRNAPGVTYLDLIASGTITHTNDDITDVILKKDPDMKHYSLRPVGFKSFSNPSAVINGNASNIFEGVVNLDLSPSIAGGLTIARLDRSYITSSFATKNVVSTTLVNSNRNKSINLLTSQKLASRGETPINHYDMRQRTDDYTSRSPRVYVQQVSPLSRGSTGVEFNGNSILGGNIASFNFEDLVDNPLYVGQSGSLSSYYTTPIDTSNFGFEAVSIYSTVDSRPAPYLLMPGDTLTMSVSKTRPVIYKAVHSANGAYWKEFNSYQLTGSHGTVMLNTGSIEITLYGSYVRNGMEFNP